MHLMIAQQGGNEKGKAEKDEEKSFMFMKQQLMFFHSYTF